MADTSLQEERIEEIKMLIKIWRSFYDLLAKAFGDATLNQQDEEEFQRIKRIVAEKHEDFMAVVNHDHHIAQIILDTVKRTISIEDFPKMSEVAINKTVIEWHDANILLYETLGQVEFERDRLSRVTSTQESSEKAGRLVSKIKEHLSNPAAKKMYAFLIIGGGLAGGCWYFQDSIARSPYYQEYVAPWWQPVWNSISGLLGG